MEPKADGTFGYEQAQLAVLQDIRDELKAIHRTLCTSQTEARRMRQAIERMDRRLLKHMPLRGQHT